MTRPSQKNDRRLLGTWKSDRRKTFQHYKPPDDFTPVQLRKFRSLFGRLIVRWGRSTCSTNLDGHKESLPYKIVATDDNSVVIRYDDFLRGPGCLWHIRFDGDYYWIALDGGHLCEWFRRIK